MGPPSPWEAAGEAWALLAVTSREEQDGRTRWKWQAVGCEAGPTSRLRPGETRSLGPEPAWPCVAVAAGLRVGRCLRRAWLSRLGVAPCPQRSLRQPELGSHQDALSGGRPQVRNGVQRLHSQKMGSCRKKPEDTSPLATARERRLVLPGPSVHMCALGHVERLLGPGSRPAAPPPPRANAHLSSRARGHCVLTRPTPRFSSWRGGSGRTWTAWTDVRPPAVR